MPRPAKTKPAPRRTKKSPDAAATTIVHAAQTAPPNGWLTIVGARQNNLRHVDVPIPLGRFVCVTGVSGSGKSSLIIEILQAALERDLNGAESVPGEHDRIDGAEQLDKCIAIDQSPIGRTPRSNPATYTKVFDLIRDLFSDLPESKVRGYKPGRFSFNVTAESGGGRCEHCEGAGQLRLDMDFLADVWVPCPICNTRRFSTPTLEVRYKQHSIADVLDLEIEQAVELFADQPKLRVILQTLHDVGLDYIKLGQPATTLSGGEAQRIKLAKELCRPDTGRTLYILDEPTTGLHFEDVRRLLTVLQRLVDHGNSVIVIEHHLDVIKSADWLIDMGLEGGSGGGTLVATGTPEDVARHPLSHTGRALRPWLERRSAVSRDSTGTPGEERWADPPAHAPPHDPAALLSAKRSESRLTNIGRADAAVIAVRGASQNNLRNIDVDIPRGQLTVACGLSGSGKSTLAFDTIYTEGQRRYVESLSSYARQFLGQLQKPKVTSITGLSPAIAIEQKNTTRSPRSTVGTSTEIYDYLRVLWARLGQQHCPDHPDQPAVRHNVDDAVTAIRAALAAAGTRSAENALLLTAPLHVPEPLSIEQRLDQLREAGVTRAYRFDASLPASRRLLPLDEFTTLPPTLLREQIARQHVLLVLDRLTPAATALRLTEGVERAFNLADGWCCLIDPAAADGPLRFFGSHLHCPACRQRFEFPTPHHLSFNAGLGWCPSCQGLGVQRGADVNQIIDVPDIPLHSGAMACMREIEEGSLLDHQLTALLTHLGVNIDDAWQEWPAVAQQQFLQGTGDAWIDVARPDDAPSRKSTKSSKTKKPAAPWFSFQWRGVFPMLDLITRISWQHRMRLGSMLIDGPCQACRGARLNRLGRHLLLGGHDGKSLSLPDACQLDLITARRWLDTLPLSTTQRSTVGEVLREALNRLQFLIDVGLGYLTLSRSAATLSGGESQRVQLASQVGSQLTGVLYVLDEPTMGLHPHDNAALIRALGRLRDIGNTLLIVEHDREVIQHADWLLELGPGAGSDGGQKVAEGTLEELRRADTLTGRYLSGRSSVPVPATRRPVDPSAIGEKVRTLIAESPRRGKPRSSTLSTAASLVAVKSDPAATRWLSLLGVTHNNLKNVDLHVPHTRLVGVTGVSGSGKSSLIADVLWPVLARQLNRAQSTPGLHKEVRGTHGLTRAALVDQSPIGVTPTSTPATYVQVFDLIRELYAKQPAAKTMGVTAGYFSFNREGGRCEICEGMGQRRIDMHFLPDVWVTCEHCSGTRYTREARDVLYRGKSIADVLTMRVSQAIELFDAQPRIARPLQTLADVGLGYLQLGQPAQTLSGGEAQRIKLAAELGVARQAPTLYLLDEPTTGLHFEDVRLLVAVLQRLVDDGHTVLVIEHNLDVLKCCDWLIELGPEAGAAGGRIVAEGTPEHVATQATPTGPVLAAVLVENRDETSHVPARERDVPPPAATRTADHAPPPPSSTPLEPTASDSTDADDDVPDTVRTRAAVKRKSPKKSPSNASPAASVPAPARLAAAQALLEPESPLDRMLAALTSAVGGTIRRDGTQATLTLDGIAFARCTPRSCTLALPDDADADAVAERTGHSVQLDPLLRRQALHLDAAAPKSEFARMAKLVAKMWQKSAAE